MFKRNTKLVVTVCNIRPHKPRNLDPESRARDGGAVAVKGVNRTAPIRRVGFGELLKEVNIPVSDIGTVESALTTMWKSFEPDKGAIARTLSPAPAIMVDILEGLESKNSVIGTPWPMWPL